MNYRLSIDKVLDEVEEDLRKAPKTMEVYLTKTLPKQIEQDIQPLRIEPRQPDYPFIWSFDPAKQARARAWWFANLKRKGTTSGHYIRTHGLVEGWKVLTGIQGNVIIISIDNPASRAVDYTQSALQVPSHKDSGWEQYEGVVLTAEERAIDSIIDTYFLIVTGNYA